MKTQALVLTIVLSLGAQHALAQQEHHPDAPPQGQPQAADSMPMTERLDRMQAIADQLAESEDPEQRRKLMQEHRQTMQDARTMTGGPGPVGGMGMMGGGKGMMGGQSGMMEGHPGMMMQRMQAMQDDLDQIMQTEDPAKRLELMKKHREQMKATMGMMRNMQQGGGKGGMGGKGMMGGPSGMMEAYRQMDKRLDLIQLLLEKLLKDRDAD